MKIIFIYPHLTETRAGDAMQPLGFALLAAKTPPDIQLELFDDRLETIDYDGLVVSKYVIHADSQAVEAPEIV